MCGDNEVFSECINGGCGPKNCSQLGKDVPCVKLDPKSCIKGCLCKERYLRDKNGVCVPESECNRKFLLIDMGTITNNVYIICISFKFRFHLNFKILMKLIPVFTTLHVSL